MSTWWRGSRLGRDDHVTQPSVPVLAPRKPGRWAAGARLLRGLGALLASPVRLVPIGFALAVSTGALLLLTPAARGTSTERVSLTIAFFHSTSAVCVTGLSSVSTVDYWSTFGKVVLAVLIQVGGIGIATLTALLGLVIVGRMGLKSRLSAATGSGVFEIGTVQRVLLGIARIFLVCESVVAVMLAVRFATHYGEPWPRAIWLGVFHSISAFNNAGFGLFSDNLVSFATDEWITGPIMAAVVVGGLGFPVILEVFRQARVSLWSVNTRLVLLTTALLLGAGALVVGAIEWDNPATLGALGGADRISNALFMSITSRTAGFNTVDYEAVSPAGQLATMALMFIGGGSASTAGGIKVGTLAVLILAIWAEARGDADTQAFDRRIDGGTVRQALAVFGLYGAQIIIATLLLLEVGGAGLARSLFEVVSATGTVGLSTNLTGELNEASLWILAGCMFLGRIGPATLVAALALQTRSRREHTVYACTECDQRYLGQQWCGDCTRPCTRVGVGGLCTSCDEPVVVDELLNPHNDDLTATSRENAVSINPGAVHAHLRVLLGNVDSRAPRMDDLHISTSLSADRRPSRGGQGEFEV